MFVAPSDWKRPTLVEILVVLSLLALLIALLLPATNTGRVLSEEELGLTADWTPGPEQAHEPTESVLARDAQITGEWTMANVYIDISGDSPGQYDVLFNTHLRCVGCTLRRTATYRDGILELDRPVRAILGPAYQRLFTVTADGTEYLLPAAYVTEFESRASEHLDNGQFSTIALSRWRGPFGDGR
jgi:hypothetical protein